MSLWPTLSFLCDRLFLFPCLSFHSTLGIIKYFYCLASFQFVAFWEFEWPSPPTSDLWPWTSHGLVPKTSEALAPHLHSPAPQIHTIPVVPSVSALAAFIWFLFTSPAVIHSSRLPARMSVCLSDLVIFLLPFSTS